LEGKGGVCLIAHRAGDGNEGKRKRGGKKQKKRKSRGKPPPTTRGLGALHCGSVSMFCYGAFADVSMYDGKAHCPIRSRHSLCDIVSVFNGSMQQEGSGGKGPFKPQCREGPEWGGRSSGRRTAGQEGGNGHHTSHGKSGPILHIDRHRHKNGVGLRVSRPGNAGIGECTQLTMWWFRVWRPLTGHQRVENMGTSTMERHLCMQRMD